MNAYHILLPICCIVLSLPAPYSHYAHASAVDPVPLSSYLEYARGSADWTWNNYDEIISKWKRTFDPENIFGYRTPGGLLEMAVIYSHLCVEESNSTYGDRAKKVLLEYGNYRSHYPESSRKARPDYEDGVPALPDFFTVMRYIRAYDTLRRRNFFTDRENELIVEMIAESIEYLLRSAEWGPMNRSALRAESLAWAVRALPQHPGASVWEMQRNALGDDNWGNWEIEDATIYHAVWLYSLLGYAEAIEKMDELLMTPEMYYYACYFLNLLCPAGMIPDFGDANWMANWSRFLVFFETAARQYRDPHLKWAAATIAKKFIDFTQPTNVGLGYILLDCYRWGDDEIDPIPPSGGSQEVMEDVQGKKIVFRNGWDDHSTYLLLNYRDEGDGGVYFRDYLRDAIPVEEEKMTHGHSDENSIVLLMSSGAVLLHDGGYRDYMPSGPYGAYRQDYFHNRLCVRPEKIWMGQRRGEYRYSVRDSVPGQPVFEFLRNAGSYRRVRTQKIDFITLPDFDYSRTRLIDDGMGYEWDRVITYVKDPELFVVFDIFKSKKEEYFTLCNLWHTRKIDSRGEHWYDTFYDRIGKEPFPGDTRLLIVFPSTHYRLEGVEPLTRHYQEEMFIHQTTAQHFEPGETVGFITLLVPHGKGVSPEQWTHRIHALSPVPARTGLGISLEHGGKHILIGVKQDLRMDNCRDWRRPRYTYESGKVRYGDIETNGDFLFCETDGKHIRYTIVNLTGAYYQDRLLYRARSSYFGLAFDGSPETKGVGKVRYWRDELLLEDLSTRREETRNHTTPAREGIDRKR
jgi:hypothetical protein